ncbi:ATP synthase F0 subunit B [Stomatohabitans albus]|uniref:ATP synthase F0 subunit B n=1 Tax=Stomatohabitans albus TaxID=3110766 RepID=UPI00300C7188
MDIETAIEELVRIVKHARPVMLSQNVQIDKAEVLSLLATVQDGLPDELRNARWVIKEREEMLAKARREADQIIEDARAEREHIVSQHEVIRQANREAQQIVESAHDEGRHIRLETEDWVEASLNQLDETLVSLREYVARGQRRLNKHLESEFLPVSIDEMNADLTGGFDLVGSSDHPYDELDDPEQDEDTARGDVHDDAPSGSAVDGMAPTRQPRRTPSRPSSRRTDVRRDVVDPWGSSEGEDA